MSFHDESQLLSLLTVAFSELVQLLEAGGSVFREETVVGVKLIDGCEAVVDPVFFREAVDREAAVSSGAQSSSSTFHPSSSFSWPAALNDKFISPQSFDSQLASASETFSSSVPSELVFVVCCADLVAVAAAAVTTDLVGEGRFDSLLSAALLSTDLLL